MHEVRMERVEGVLVLELSRSKKRNAINFTMFESLADALTNADTDERVRAVLLCGAGDDFCAGHDLEAFAQWPQAPGDPVPRFLHALAGLRKPLVVAVQGWAVGIGATALLHADWVIASPECCLRFPFIDLGIAPEAGSSLLLARAVGSLRARQLLLEGSAIDAATAHAWGLVTELAAVDQLRASAVTRSKALAAKSPAGFGRIKDWLASDVQLHDRIDEEIAAINHAVLARRKAEGVKS